MQLNIIEVIDLVLSGFMYRIQTWPWLLIYVILVWLLEIALFVVSWCN